MLESQVPQPVVENARTPGRRVACPVSIPRDTNDVLDSPHAFARGHSHTIHTARFDRYEVRATLP